MRLGDSLVGNARQLLLDKCTAHVNAGAGKQYNVQPLLAKKTRQKRIPLCLSAFQPHQNAVLTQKGRFCCRVPPDCESPQWLRASCPWQHGTCHAGRGMWPSESVSYSPVGTKTQVQPWASQLCDSDTVCVCGIINTTHSSNGAAAYSKARKVFCWTLQQPFPMCLMEVNPPPPRRMTLRPSPQKRYICKKSCGNWKCRTAELHYF